MQTKQNEFDAETSQDLRFLLLSHDIRSVLSGIVGGLSLIEGATLTEQEQGHLARVKSAGRMLADLIEESGADPSARTPRDLDPAPVIEQIRARWENEGAANGVVINFGDSTNLPPVTGLSRVGFARIFNNLIGNAMKSPGVSVIEMTFDTTNTAELGVKISDNGGGFSATALEHAFQIWGGKVNTGRPQNGLGLYIVKSLVEHAGGRVRAFNRTQGGACVEVVLKSGKPVKPRQPATANALPDLSNLNILVAEDNVTNQLVVTQMLLALNAKFSVASDGVEALQLFEQEPFDLGLIDIEMPRKSGLEVIREVRNRPDARAKTPLVALTAYAMDDHRERIHKAGADGLIPKPITDIARFGEAILGFCTQTPTPAVEQTTPDGTVIDRSIYDALAEVIGKDSMVELLGKVQQDLRSVQSGLNDGMAAHDTAPIRANTHILMSVAGAIGAVGLQSVAQNLNQAAGQGDWPRVTPLADECQKGLDLVQTFVTKELSIW